MHQQQHADTTLQAVASLAFDLLFAVAIMNTTALIKANIITYCSLIFIVSPQVLNTSNQLQMTAKKETYMCL